MLQIQNASVVFAGDDGRLVHALDRVSVDIAPDSIVVALGASGCGKSTLLNAVAGFMPLSDGTILLDGRPVTGPGADRGVVFQKDTLLPWRSVADNVALGLEFAGLPRAARRRRVSDLLRLVQLDGFAEAQPHELSGGMRQRVGLARALATDPKILLMDEPFGALDSLTRETMQLLLLRVWAETRKQILFITHSIEEALLLGTTILVMSPRPGRVVERREPGYARRLAAGETVDVIRRETAFVALHEELRRLLHASEAAGALS
ncbi:MAG: taurine ABC transporter ATP-binding protein [Janthinobacterium lividum]